MGTPNLLRPQAPAQHCTPIPSLLRTGRAQDRWLFGGEGRSFSWHPGLDWFPWEPWSFCSCHTFGFGGVAPPAGWQAFEELNSCVARDWGSGWVRERVTRSKCLLPSPLALLSLSAPRRSLSRALAPLPLSTALFRVPRSPEEPPLHHTRNVLYCGPLPSVGFHHQSHGLTATTGTSPRGTITHLRSAQSSTPDKLT